MTYTSFDIIQEHIDNVHQTASAMALKQGKVNSGHTYGDQGVESPTTRIFEDFSRTTTAPIVDDAGEATTTSTLRLPTAAEVATHLELLEAFFALRQRVIGSVALDDVFAAEARPKTVHSKKRHYHAGSNYTWETKKIRDSKYPDRRRLKWERYFLPIASARFRVWAPAVEAELGKADEVGDKKALRLPHLPPLDILMVWHGFLLNPADFASYCEKHHLHCLPKVEFPWQRIHDVLSSQLAQPRYSIPAADKTWFEEETNLHGGGGTVPTDDLCDDLERYANTDSVMHSAFQHSKESIPSPSKPGAPDLSPTDRATLQAMWQANLGRLDSELVLCWLSLNNDGNDKDDSQAKKKSVASARDRTTTGEETARMVGNVQRQATFVDKMHKHLWLRSPACEGTLRRALDRYEKFVGLFRHRPNNKPNVPLVPTLDVDIVWHTHQCSASLYRDAMTRRAGFFVDHDDKIAQPGLDTGMETTGALFRDRYGEQYERCLCWECEATLSAIEAADRDGTLQTLDGDAIAESVIRDVNFHRGLEFERRRLGGGDSSTLPVASVLSW